LLLAVFVGDKKQQTLMPTFQGDYTLTVHGMNQLELMANTRAKDAGWCF